MKQKDEVVTCCDDNRPVMVSICCATYNHEPYIRQCLDGFVMQKTNFRIEAIVHDDASTDGTTAIVREYAEMYPDIIKPLFETENQYSKHDGSLKIKMDEACSGKYIAMCEGDDYWIDPLKLQKQVDFMEAHSDYAFCCHRFSIYIQKLDIFRKEYDYNIYADNEDLEITWDVFSKFWVTQPLTALMRKDAYFSIIDDYKKHQPLSRDVHIFYYLLKKGRGIVLNNQMGVYRWHNAGVASEISIDKKFKAGYNIYKDLYEKNCSDPYMRIKYFRNLIGCIRSNKILPISKSYPLLKEGLIIHKNYKEMFNLLFSYVFPKSCFNMVSKYLFNRNLR